MDAAIAVDGETLKPRKRERIEAIREGGPWCLWGGAGQKWPAPRDSLLTGLMTGQNPRKIARLVRQAFGVPLSRALTISRTEVLRAYRESTRRTYQANRHLIRGWRWLAAHSRRTCAMCLAMDGSIHSLEEQLVNHPNGRCAMTPVLVDEEPPARETGEQWLERQKPDVQERVLGKAGAEAYRAGAVTLQDFVGRRYSEEWGTTRYARSLRQILGPEEALRWRREALVRAKAVSESLRPARFVGAARGRFGELLEERSGTRVVRVVPAVVEHYRKHAGQFDLRRAEALLPTVLADPLKVVQGKKATTLVAVGEYDAEHYLVVPVKSLPGENWLETLYIDRKQKFEDRKWVVGGMIFKRRD